MSAASVSAYLSPTIFRNFAISSAESGGTEPFPIFIVRSRSFPSHSRAAQPVVDGFAQSMRRDGHHRDSARLFGVELAKIAEKIRGGLIQITADRQIHDGGGVFRCRRQRAEGEQGFAGLDRTGVEPHAR